MWKVNALGVNVKKHKTTVPAIDTSRRNIRQKIVEYGRKTKKDILKYVKESFATSGTGDEVQSPHGGEPFVFTQIDVHKGTYNATVNDSIFF